LHSFFSEQQDFLVSQLPLLHLEKCEQEEKETNKAPINNNFVIYDSSVFKYIVEQE
jgi:hypothetical protein